MDKNYTTNSVKSGVNRSFRLGKVTINKSNCRQNINMIISELEGNTESVFVNWSISAMTLGTNYLNKLCHYSLTNINPTFTLTSVVISQSTTEIIFELYLTSPSTWRTYNTKIIEDVYIPVDGSIVEFYEKQDTISTIPTGISKVNSILIHDDTIIVNHISSDDDRWNTTLDSFVKIEARLKKYAQDLYAGTIPVYDYSNPTTIIGTDGLIKVGSGQEYTITGNGAINCQVGGLLGTAILVKINDVVVWTSPTVVLGIKVGGDNNPSDDIQVSTGDIITTEGLLGVGQTLNITFYPNKL